MKPNTPQPDPDRCRITRVKNAGAPWTVSYPAVRSGKVGRIRKSFASEEKARRFAAEMDMEIAQRGIHFGSLPPEVRRAYRHFLKASSEPSANGFPDFESFVLESIKARYRDADSLLLTTAEATEQFLDDKAADLTSKTLRSLRLRLQLFAQSLGDRPIQSITAADINTWLTGLQRQRKPQGRHMGSASPSGLSALSINHYRSALSALFRYAAQENWIASNPVAAVLRAEVKAPEVFKPHVYMPDEVAAIMRTALDYRPDILPALALSMFAGLRLDEAARTELSTLFSTTAPQSGHLVLPGGNSKTNERHIPISDALRGWLEVQPRRAGYAWEGTKAGLRAKIDAVLKMAAVKPINGAPRYTYIAHRWAQTQDVLKIIAECGIPFGMVKSFTENPVSSDDAEKFFSIMPGTTI